MDVISIIVTCRISSHLRSRLDGMDGFFTVNLGYRNWPFLASLRSTEKERETKKKILQGNIANPNQAKPSSLVIP